MVKAGQSAIPATVHLSLTVAQAKVVADALELYARLGLGQVEMVTEAFNKGCIPVNTNADKGKVDKAQARLRLEKHCSSIKEALGFSPYGHYGITDAQVPEAAKHAYEVERVLRKSLAVHRDPAPVFRGTEYDGLMIRCTGERVPACVVDG